MAGEVGRMFGTGSRHVGPPWIGQTGLSGPSGIDSEDHLRIHRPLLPLQADHMKTDGMGSDNNPFVLIIQSRSYRLSALPHGSALPKKTNISKVISLLHRKKLAGQQLKEFKICMLRHFLCNKQSNNITSSGSVNGHCPSFRSRLFGISVSLFG